MNDSTIMRRYYESKLEEAPGAAPPEALIKSAAASAGFRPAPAWENAFGSIITIFYLWHFLNPYNWFSLCRFFLGLMNGFSFSQYLWSIRIGL